MKMADVARRNLHNNTDHYTFKDFLGLLCACRAYMIMHPQDWRPGSPSRIRVRPLRRIRQARNLITLPIMEPVSTLEGATVLPLELAVEAQASAFPVESPDPSPNSTVSDVKPPLAIIGFPMASKSAQERSNIPVVYLSSGSDWEDENGNDGNHEESPEVVYCGPSTSSRRSIPKKPLTPRQKKKHNSPAPFQDPGREKRFASESAFRAIQSRVSRQYGNVGNNTVFISEASTSRPQSGNSGLSGSACQINFSTLLPPGNLLPPSKTVPFPPMTSGFSGHQAVQNQNQPTWFEDLAAALPSEVGPPKRMPTKQEKRRLRKKNNKLQKKLALFPPDERDAAEEQIKHDQEGARIANMEKKRLKKLQHRLAFRASLKEKQQLKQLKLRVAENQKSNVKSHPPLRSQASGVKLTKNTESSGDGRRSSSAFGEPSDDPDGSSVPQNSDPRGYTAPDGDSAEDVTMTEPSELTFIEQTLKISDSAHWLLLTKQPVVIAGLVRVVCYAGCAEIAGYRLRPGMSQLVIPSLSSESWLSIHGCEEPVNVVDFEAVASKHFVETVVGPCSKVLERNAKQWNHQAPVTAVVLMLSTNSVSDPLLWNCLRLFPALVPEMVEPKGQFESRPLRVGPKWRKELFPQCNIITPITLARHPQYISFKDKFWTTISDALTQLPSAPFPVILLCGSKNVGKSTTVRYIINHLLRTFPSVQCFDCDMGQSEFNPPGCLAIHTLTEPVLGAPFCRLHEPDIACYLGEVSPSVVTNHYENCLKFVLEKGRNPSFPLVVNTMGWVERLGLQLLQKASTMVRPNLVIELMNPTESRAGVAATLTRTPCGRILNLPSVVLPEQLKKPFTPALRRRISLVSYLAPISPSFGPVNSVTPFGVKFEDFVVFFTDPMVPITHYLTTMLGACVGLAVWENPVGVQQAEGVRYTRIPPLCQNLGFGIVRGIDKEKEMVYVLTPVKEELLQKVNVLIRGSISTPEELMIGQNLTGWTGLVPRMQ